MCSSEASSTPVSSSAEQLRYAFISTFLTPFTLGEECLPQSVSTTVK